MTGQNSNYHYCKAVQGGLSSINDVVTIFTGGGGKGLLEHKLLWNDWCSETERHGRGTQGRGTYINSGKMVTTFMDSPFWEGGGAVAQYPDAPHTPPITCFKGQTFHAWFVPRRRYSGISIEKIRFLRRGWLQCSGALAGGGGLLAVMAVGRGPDRGLIFSR